MGIKSIIFDLDDTLVVEEASAEAAFAAACKLVQKRSGIAPEDFNLTVRQKARELWYKAPARDYCVAIGVSSWEGLWSRFEGDDPDLKIMHKWARSYQQHAWVDALAEYGVKDESFAQLLNETFQSHRRGLHIVYPDVEGVLKELGRSYELVLVSNGAPDLQREKLDGSRLGKYFGMVVVSGDIGIGKPDPRIFTMVLEKLGVSAETAVMVGNSLRSDIAGAQQIGLKAVWLNRDGKEPNSSVEPDYEINNLNELKHVLNDLEN